MTYNNTDKLFVQNEKLLNLLRFYKGIERSELSRRLQLSMPTIYNTIDVLNNNNIVIKKGSDVLINAKYGTLIGISIGSSLCKICFSDFNFQIFTAEDFKLHKENICREIKELMNDTLLNECINDTSKNYIYFKTPTSFSLLKDILNRFFNYIKDCVFNDILNILSIGISCTGIVNDETQTILTSHNLTYLDNTTLDTLILPANKMFFSKHNIYVCLVQNSNASIIAEKIHLNLSDSLYKKKKNIISLYLGVGIGAGIYTGHLYAGTHGYAGEIGHSPAPCIESETDITRHTKLIEQEVIENCCTCGHDNCYDYKIRSYVFEKTAMEFCNMSSTEIRNYLFENSEKAKLLSIYLGNIINTLTCILNIDLIIFTGKFYKSMDLLMDTIDTIQDENPMKFNRNDCEILASDLGSLAPSLGAAIFSYHKKYDLELSWNY